MNRNTNHSEQQGMDCVSFVPKYIHTAAVLIYSQINILQLVHPTHNRCNIGQGQTITITNKYGEVMESNSWERIPHHGEEHAMARVTFVSN